MFLSHFSIVKQSHYEYLKLSRSEELLKMLPSYYRQCYISDEDLKSRILKQKKSMEEVIKMYIPDPGKTMSGEFSEILSYQLIQDQHTSVPLFGPKKWLWKNDRNEPMKKTDVVLFGQEDENTPSLEDVIVAAEIKTKSTRGSFHPIQDGIKGTVDDHVTRLAKTFTWLEEQYTRLNEPESFQKIERFVYAIEPRFGPYKKKYKTIAVIDEDFIDEEINKDIDTSIFMYKQDWKRIENDCLVIGATYNPDARRISFKNVKKDDLAQIQSINKELITKLYDLYNLNIGDSFDVTVIGVKNLKDYYETTYTNILSSYEVNNNE